MLKIWKFTIVPEDYQQVEVPVGSYFLSAIEQNDLPVVYALVNPVEPKVKVPILVRGTGHPIDSNILLMYRFLGTVSTHQGNLVWHIFVDRKY